MAKSITSNPTRILIVRIGHLGDLLLTLPALKMLQHAYPQAKLSIVTLSHGIPMVKNCGIAFENVWIYSHGFLKRHWTRHKAMRDMPPFDLGFYFETSPKYQRFLHTCRQTFCLPPNQDHMAEANIKLVQQALPNAAVPTSPLLHPNESATQEAATIYQDAGIGAHDTVIGVHPSAYCYHKKSMKQERLEKLWDPTNFATLSQVLQPNKVVMDLLPSEKPLGDDIAQKSHGRITHFNLPPKFSRYMAMLSRMDVLVTPDTGTMHLAALLGVKIVALFCGKDPAIWGPYCSPDNVKILRAKTINEISPDAVADAVQSLL